MNNEDKINVLIESHKLISEETKQYRTEMMRSFVYAAFVLALALGFDPENTGKLVKYMPYAMIGLLVYFLSIGFMYVSANRYKAQLEYRINKLAQETLVDFELRFKPELISRGLLPRPGKPGRFFPTPNIMLGIIVIVGFVIMISVNFSWEKDEILHAITLLITAIIMVLIGVYVFVYVPRIIEDYQKKRYWISDSDKDPQQNS